LKLDEIKQMKKEFAILTMMKKIILLELVEE
jgi:hypothetical protein